MTKTIIILACTAFFALLGLAAAALLMWHIHSGRNHDLGYQSRISDWDVVICTFAAPFLGSVVGLIVGCVGVGVGTWLTRYSDQQAPLRPAV
jgi:uncharacterized membrane protein YfcA